MIKQSKIQTVKTIFFMLMICSLSQGIQAQIVEKLNSIETTANIKYLGISDGMFVFDVKYNNPKAEKFLFEITESSNNNLFRELGRDKLFTKKFKIPTDMGELKFTIKNVNDNSAQVFIVNRNQRVYEDVVVRKIN